MLISEKRRFVTCVFRFRDGSFSLYRLICVGDNVATVWPSLARACVLVKIVYDRI